MLTNNPVSATSAVVSGATVRVAGGLACPDCLRTVQAHDAERIGDGWRFICARCHRDLAVIEPLSPRGEPEAA